MADRVTCCPHCSTSFRITDTQLQSAKGAVRCGSCLKVFKALDHLLPTPEPLAASTGDAEPPKMPSEKTPEEPPVHEDISAPRASFIEVDVDLDADKASSDRLSFDQHAIDEVHADDLHDDDEMLISDDMDKIEDTQNITLGNLSADFQSDHGAGLFDRDIKISAPLHQDDSDESWAVGLLEDDESEAENSDDLGLQQQDISQTDADFDYSRATTGTFNALDDADIEAALGESLHSSERKEPIFSLVEDEQAPHELDENPFSADEVFENAPYAVDDADDNVAMLLQAIQPAPVEMEWQESSAWPQRLLWGSLSLLAAITLAAQIGVYKFNDLSRIEPYRSLYASSCPLLGCQLPSIADPARVKAYNLVIRSHPRTDNALVVDSILLNSAPFTQPFPDLLLNFGDIKGRPIASRRFTPAEYLSGEMAGITEMPNGQPVHISLDIIDPGPEAVNYSVEVPLN